MADKTAGTGTTDTGDGKTPGTAEGQQPAPGTEKQPATGTAGTEGEAGKGAKPGGTEGAAKPVPKAPEKYALTLADDVKADLDAADLKYLEEVARANDWTQDEAQTELNLASERIRTKQKAIANAHLEALKSNEDFGGDHLEQTQQLTKRAIDRVLPPGNKYRDDFLKLVNDPTIGNRVPVIAFLASLGKLVGEDTAPSASSAPSGTSGDAASKMYDHPSSKKMQTTT